MSMFVFLNSTLQVFQKNISIKQYIKQQKYLYERNIDHKSIYNREFMVYYLLLPQQNRT